MRETDLVDINIDALRQNLSRLNRWTFTDEEVRSWLTSMNFVQAERGWIADAPALDRLEPEEIVHTLPFAPRYEARPSFS